MNNVRGREIHPHDDHPQHFACFACRKAFKQRGSWLVRRSDLRPFPCPDCTAPMTPLGRDFKAPPRRDRAQWLKVELLHAFGVVFETPTETPGGPGPRPGKLNEAVDFLVARGRERAQVEGVLAALRQRRGAEPGAASDTAGG
jgi:hypothetical protein